MWCVYYLSERKKETGMKTEDVKSFLHNAKSNK